MSDFSDEISQRIFYWRERFYNTRDYSNLIEMHCEDYDNYISKINKWYTKIKSRVTDFGGKFVIYGNGVHAHLLRDF